MISSWQCLDIKCKHYMSPELLNELNRGGSGLFLFNQSGPLQ